MRKSQRSKSTVKVNADNDLVNDDVNRCRGRWRHLGLTLAGEPGACWRVAARGGSWRCVAARDQPYRNFERRVRAPTMLRLSRFSRSAQDDLCGSFKTVIEAMLVAVMWAAVVCAMWNSLTTAAAGPEPKDDSWMTSKVQRRKAATVVVMAEAMWKKKRSHTNKDKIAKKKSE